MIFSCAYTVRQRALFYYHPLFKMSHTSIYERTSSFKKYSLTLRPTAPDAPTALRIIREKVSSLTYRSSEEMKSPLSGAMLPLYRPVLSGRSGPAYEKAGCRSTLGASREGEFWLVFTSVHMPSHTQQKSDEQAKQVQELSEVRDEQSIKIRELGEVRFAHPLSPSPFLIYCSSWIKKPCKIEVCVAYGLPISWPAGNFTLSDIEQEWKHFRPRRL